MNSVIADTRSTKMELAVNDPTPGSLVRDAESRESEDGNLSQVIGANLKTLRRRRGHSLERLANLSGVSRAMLSQIEHGRSMPTIKIVWRIAKALDIPFSALITDSSISGISVVRQRDGQLARTPSGKAGSRTLVPFRSPRRFECHEWHLFPSACETVSKLPAGTLEHIVVLQGTLHLEVEGDCTTLCSGDAAVLNGDVPRLYRNVGPDTLRLHVTAVFTEPVP